MQGQKQPNPRLIFGDCIFFLSSLSPFSFFFFFHNFWKKLNGKGGDHLQSFHLLRVFFQRFWHSHPCFSLLLDCPAPSSCFLSTFESWQPLQKPFGGGKKKFWCGGDCFQTLVCSSHAVGREGRFQIQAIPATWKNHEHNSENCGPLLARLTVFFRSYFPNIFVI